MLSRVPKNPFKVLGVSPSSSFETIQKRFNELALKYHPDSSSASSSTTAPSAAATGNYATASSGSSGGGGDASQFIRIRQAFEYIRKTRFDTKHNSSSGSTLRRHTRHGHGHHHHGHHHHQNHTFSESDFLDYFFEQTGVRLSSDQRREMIELYRSKTPGYYGGHSWDIARRLSFEQDSYLARMKEHQDINDDIFQQNDNRHNRGTTTRSSSRSNDSNHQSSHRSSNNNDSSEDINDDGTSSFSSKNLRSRRRKRRR